MEPPPGLLITTGCRPHGHSPKQTMSTDVNANQLQYQQPEDSIVEKSY